MDVDTDKDTIDFLGMSSFLVLPTCNSSVAILSLGEAGIGGVSNLFEEEPSSYYRLGESLITYDMSEYLIDLIEKDGECYMPLQTVNDLFLPGNNKVVVFTGEEVLTSSISRSFSLLATAMLWLVMFGKSSRSTRKEGIPAFMARFMA